MFCCPDIDGRALKCREKEVIVNLHGSILLSVQEDFFFHPPRFFFIPLISIYAPKTVSFEKFEKHLPNFLGFLTNKWLKHLFFYIGKLR
jgi:hypothetical protein